MIKKEIFIGFLVAMVAASFGFYIYLEFVSQYSFEETLKIIDEQNLYGKILGLSALPNLFVFFIYLKKKQDYRARGVILACILIAIGILVTQFI